MKKSLILIMLILLVVVLVAAPVMANSSYNYTIKHSLDLKTDGDFTFNSTIVTPAQGNVDINLAGEGKAELKSILEIIESRIETRNWFDLF